MKRFFSTLTLLLVFMAMMAAPAKRGVVRTITLSDGTEMKATLVGDEYGHYWKGADGKCYVMSNGEYVLMNKEAQQQAKARRAKAQQNRAKRMKANKANVQKAPLTGNKKGLIILVNFKDVTFQTSNADTKTLYTNVANTTGYSDENGFDGSVADYFNAQSRGVFKLTFDVVGPVTVTNNMSYYGQNVGNADAHPGSMVIEAVNLAKSSISNWKQYDWDNDGYVDQVMVIYAGEGEASGGADDTIWPHEYSLKYAQMYDHDGSGPVNVGTTSAPLYVDTYAVANEGMVEQSFFGDSFTYMGIGTICHEFSHCLGLMDMYDTQYSGNFGMDKWDLMDQGSYNNGGFTPANYSSYEKMEIGWITPTELTNAKSVSAMKAWADDDECYKITNKANDKEFYLLENRQKKGWDQYVPGSGLLILHVDYDQTLWEYNLINSTVEEGNDQELPVNDHQRCTIFHADGQEKSAEYNAQLEVLINKYDDKGDLSDAEWDKYEDLIKALEDDAAHDVYPQSGNTELSNTSTPRAFTYNANSDGRKLMNIKISNIKQNTDGTIAFNFAPDNTGTEEGDNTYYGDIPSGDGDYEKVTSTSQLVVGMEYVLVNEANEAGCGAYNSSKNYLEAVSVSVSDKGVSGSELVPLTLGGSATGYSLALDGKYLTTTEAKKLKLSTTESKIWKISSTTDGYVVKNDNYGTIQYNSTSPRFLNYTSTQKPAVLYVRKTTTGIQGVEIVNHPADGKIYSIDGRYVGTDLSVLKHGIYIMNGKKVVIK